MPQKKIIKFVTKEFTLSVEPDNIFHVVIHSCFTPDGYKTFEKKGKEFIKRYHLNKVLNDARLMTPECLEGYRKKLTELAQSVNMKKTALVLKDKFQLVINRFILLPTDPTLNESVRFFSTKKEAFEWLRKK